MVVELRNFHVIILDHDIFDGHVFNFHTIFFDGTNATKYWEIFLAEAKNDS